MSSRPSAASQRPPPEPRPRSSGTRTSPLLRLLLPILILIAALWFAPVQDSTPILTSSLGSAGKALILTAHPDDEVMFFTPTILALRKAGWDVSGLCLSTGDADGLGDTRRHELTSSYQALGVDSSKVMVVDHPLLQDDIHTRWPIGTIESVVNSFLSDKDISLVITFDSQGISNHLNHASLSTYRSNHTHILHLVSPSLATKYLGPLSSLSNSYIGMSPSTILENLLEWMFRDWNNVLSGGNTDESNRKKEREAIHLRTDLHGWKIGVQAMLEHRTQMVWFRWLYLGFSQLMWSNDLEIVA